MAVSEIQPVATTSAERLPGCDSRCIVVLAFLPGIAGRSEIRLHDARSHEAHGAATAVETRVIRTGPLVVDLGASRVYVSGQEIRLTAQEWSLLAALARRPGAIRTHDELLQEAWGAEYLGEQHVLRTTINRLRRRIGGASLLIVNRTKAGYLLALAPPIAAPLVPLALSAPKRWARDWDACRGCGTTTSVNHGQGCCRRCYLRWRKESGR